MKKETSASAQELNKSSSSKKKDYVEINIPKFSFKNGNINYFLVIALIVLGFIGGMLTNKVLYLQDALKNAKSESPTNNIAAANALPQAAPTLAPKVDVAVGHLPTLGNENAKVTVVEFSDFQCPFCKQFEDDTYSQLYDTYIKTNKIKFAYRQYPLVTIHPNAQKSAEASECANEQGKFWDYHDLVFKNQSSWSALAAADAANSFTDLAGQLGMDTTQFKSCLDSDKYKPTVDSDAADGSKAGVDGTPTFFINGWRLVGAQPFAQIQQLIEQELKK